MEKAKLNTYSVTIDYESPRPINFGDVYYEAFEEDKLGYEVSAYEDD